MAHCKSTLLLVTVLLIGAAPSALAEAPATLDSRYAAAAEVAANGSPERALDQLARLADERPDSVPVHRAIALLALETGRTDMWRATFAARVRRMARDVGASVGLAILENARGERAAAHRLLTTALTAESRDPLLVPLLLDTAADPDGLVAWMRQRQAVLPHDPLFASLVARALLARDRVSDAASVLERARLDDPEQPDLSLLHALTLRAAGEERHACEVASLASGFLLERTSAAETRVPDRVALVRVLVACGFVDEAEGVLARLGPRDAIGVGSNLEREIALAEAEWRVATGQPLAALEILETRIGETGLPAAMREAALAIRARAAAATGAVDDALVAAVLTPLPRGLALADRAWALAALSEVEGLPDRARLASEIERAALAAENAAWPVRAERLHLLASHLRGDARPNVRAKSELPRSATRTVATAIVAASASLRAGRAEEALLRASLEPLGLVGAPGQLVARLRLVAARAAFAEGQRTRALELIQDGLLDIQEADRARPFLPIELAAIAGDPSETAAMLAGLGLRASIEEGMDVAEATTILVRQLGRTVRGWSVLETGWSGGTDALIAAVTPKSCLVVAPGGEDALAVVIDADGALSTPATNRALEDEPCRSARTIYWLGPMTAPGGLSPAAGDSRVLVRLVGPGAIARRTPAQSEPPLAPPATLVAEGPPRASSEAIRRLARRTTTIEVPDDARAPGVPAFAYVGTGLALARAPLASGWLVPPGGDAEPGWLGPESILSWPATGGGGLVAAGLARRPAAPLIDKGSWVLAEAALSSGRSWVLLSTRPLDDDEWTTLRRNLDAWRVNPIDAARELVLDHPSLALSLAVWSAPGSLPEESDHTALYVFVALALGAAAGATVLARRALRSRAARTVTEESR